MVRKKLWLSAITTLLFLPLVSGCHDQPEYEDTKYGNFDALWDIVDTRYCFFEEKNLDWEQIGRDYRALIKPETTYYQLFFICAAMLDELQDGHVNLSSRFNTSYYRKWWSDYPQDFSLRTVEENYLDFDWLSSGGITYKVLPDDIGYLHYPSFSYAVGDGTLDYILATFSQCRGLIIDIRDNGGGALTNISTFVGRFIDKPITGGYIRHKTGPGHNDFSEPYRIEYKPAKAGHIMWMRPIVLLTNRSCFSAANDFTSVMKSLPNVIVAGAKTGGGGGLPFSSELPVGWAVRFSACPLLSPDGKSTENGIDPTEGCEVHAPAEELAEGRDAILDFAIAKMMECPLPENK